MTKKKRSWENWRKRRAIQLRENLNRYGDYRDILVAELARRKTLSPHYSLRDFAKNLGLSPSQTSRLLRKERGLSKEAAFKISAALGLAGMARQRFIFLVQAISGRSLWIRGLARQGLQRKGIHEAAEPMETFKIARPSWREQVKEILNPPRPRDFSIDRRLRACLVTKTGVALP